MGMKKNKPHWKRCKHAKAEGQYIVDVLPTCKKPPHIIKGRFVVSKGECMHCSRMEERA